MYAGRWCWNTLPADEKGPHRHRLGRSPHTGRIAHPTGVLGLDPRRVRPICVAIGGEHAGVVTGVMNTAGQFGGHQPASASENEIRAPQRPIRARRLPRRLARGENRHDLAAPAGNGKHWREALARRGYHAFVRLAELVLQPVHMYVIDAGRGPAWRRPAVIQAFRPHASWLRRVTTPPRIHLHGTPAPSAWCRRTEI
jgi:hypothetical protein